MEIRVTTFTLPPMLHADAQRRVDKDKEFAAIEKDLMPALVQLRLDQNDTTYVGKKHDLVCFLIHVNRGPRKREPAILLVNQRYPTTQNTHLLLSELWLLIDPVVQDDPVATRALQANQQSALRMMAEHLYGFVMRDSANYVLDAVFEFAEDLKNAKPPRNYNHQQWLQACAEDDLTFHYNGVAVN